MTNTEIRSRFLHYLSDGHSWIGIFENQALDSRDVGTRIALCFDDDYWDTAILGKSIAPDTKTAGIGWRYILVAKCRTVEQAMTMLTWTEWPLVEAAMIANADDKP